MADETKKTEIKTETATEEGSYWWLYLLGILILLIAGYFVFRNNWSTFLKKGTEKIKAEPTAILTAETNITIEAEIQQIIPSQNTFFIKNKAGFTVLTYGVNTEFVNEKGEKIALQKIKAGNTVRAEGKPNGKIFTAKKIKLIGEGESEATEVSGKTKPTPWKLPETGIGE